MGKNDIQTRKIKVIVLLILALSALIWSLVPESVAFRSPAVCIHYKLFGVPCPFCGMMRASYQLMHFRFMEAWRYNPLIFYLAGLYLLEWTTQLPHPAFRKVRTFSWWIGAGMMIILYIIRLTA